MFGIISTLLTKNLYIGIPMGAFCCSLFLLFCFFNARKNTTIHFVRGTLVSLLLWTGGVTLMRLQASPGVNFWHHFSIIGLLFTPILVYAFMMNVLGIENRKGILYLSVIITEAALIYNGFTEQLLPPPTVLTEADGTVTFHYQIMPLEMVLGLMELLLLLYFARISFVKIAEDAELKRSLIPILLGLSTIFLGNCLCLIPGNVFPLDMLGAVGMGICLVYVMYKQSLFGFSSRITTGAIYFLSGIVALLPMALFFSYLDRLNTLDDTIRQHLFFFMLLECIWAVIIMIFARGRVERSLSQKHRQIEECLHRFQDTASSILDKDSLYREIRSIVKEAIPESEADLFELRNDNIWCEVLIGKDGKNVYLELADKSISWVENEVIRYGGSSAYPEIALFHGDDGVKGFLRVSVHGKHKLSLDELDFIRQIGNTVSSCVKNIIAYERVYQASIHDDLTGLYNRNYCTEYLGRLKVRSNVFGLIYLDMDNFKLYNDLYGEELGDQVLVWCARRIRMRILDAGAVFRVGSNEFLVVTWENDREKLVALAGEFQKLVWEDVPERPNVMQPITFSIGIAWYPGMSDSVNELYRQARQAAFYAKRNGKNRIEVYEKDQENTEENEEGGYEQAAPTVYALVAAIDAKDSFTFRHSNNVSDYAVLLAQKLGLSANDIRTVREAGLLHDIGKIGIPESILTKPDRLTDAEYAIMKTHVEKSIEMIHYLPNMNYVIPAVVSHHERYDGKGYPRGVKGEEIPLLGRILTVCDSFDAMVSKRAYKKPLSIEYAIGELERNKGTQFDPDVADAFIELIKEGAIVVEAAQAG